MYLFIPGHYTCPSHSRNSHPLAQAAKELVQRQKKSKKPLACQLEMGTADFVNFEPLL